MAALAAPCVRCHRDHDDDADHDCFTCLSEAFCAHPELHQPEDTIGFSAAALTYNHLRQVHDPDDDHVPAHTLVGDGQLEVAADLPAAAAFFEEHVIPVLTVFLATSPPLRRSTQTAMRERHYEDILAVLLRSAVSFVNDTLFDAHAEDVGRFVIHRECMMHTVGLVQDVSGPVEFLVAHDKTGADVTHLVMVIEAKTARNFHQPAVFRRHLRQTVAELIAATRVNRVARQLLVEETHNFDDVDDADLVVGPGVSVEEVRQAIAHDVAENNAIQQRVPVYGLLSCVWYNHFMLMDDHSIDQQRRIQLQGNAVTPAALQSLFLAMVKRLKKSAESLIAIQCGGGA